MRFPRWAVVIAALMAALPFGWGLGVFVAFLIAGPDFGQLPALTVPVCILASIVFAILPVLPAATRLIILAIGTGLFILIGLWT
jgi:hypothetical protein